MVGAGGLTVQASKAVGNNNGLVEDDFNDATYEGARFGLKYIVNDEWDVLLQHTTQTLETEGVFDYDPTVGDLKWKIATRQTVWTTSSTKPHGP